MWFALFTHFHSEDIDQNLYSRGRCPRPRRYLDKDIQTVARSSSLSSVFRDLDAVHPRWSVPLSPPYSILVWLIEMSQARFTSCMLSIPSVVQFMSNSLFQSALRYRLGEADGHRRRPGKRYRTYIRSDPLPTLIVLR